MSSPRATGRDASAVAGAQSIRRAVKVLRTLAVGQERGVRLTDIVAECGLTQATVHRILRVLIEEGAVEQDGLTRRYLIGQEVSLLGLARVARFPIRAIAETCLAHLGDEIGDTAFLTIRSGVDSICVDRKTGSYPIKVLSIEVGARRPLGVGVGGLALLAHLPDEEAAEVIRANERRLAQHRITPARLAERIRVTRARGYAYADVGVVKGTRAVAVIVRSPAGAPLAAISIAAISERLDARRLPGVVAMMQDQSAQITRRIAEIERARR